MSKTFYTSDLHFGHKNIIEYCNRPYRDVEEMDYRLIRNWNSVVGLTDLVYVLGDVSFHPLPFLPQIIKELNGIKVLIKGNHDYRIKNEKIARECGFEAMYEEFDLEIHPHLVTLSHYPFRGDNTPTDRFTERRPQDFSQWLLHGHVHTTWKIKPEERMINVGVDVWGYTPVSEDTIKEIMNERVN